MINEPFYVNLIALPHLSAVLPYHPVPDRYLDKRVAQVNKQIALSADKYRKWELEKVTAEDLYDWWQEWRESPYDDWRAFLDVSRPDTYLPTLHPYVEQAIETVGSQRRTPDTAAYPIGLLWHEIVKKTATEMPFSPQLKFPTPNMVQRHLAWQIGADQQGITHLEKPTSACTALALIPVPCDA